MSVLVSHNLPDARFCVLLDPVDQMISQLLYDVTIAVLPLAQNYFYSETHWKDGYKSTNSSIKQFKFRIEKLHFMQNYMVTASVGCLLFFLRLERSCLDSIAQNTNFALIHSKSWDFLWSIIYSASWFTRWNVYWPHLFWWWWFE